MKILNICRLDFGGNGIAMTQAINAYTEHQSRHICMRRHPFDYPVDIVTKRRGHVLREWLGWADVISCWVTFQPIERSWDVVHGRKLVIHYVGSHYYNNHDRCHRIAERNGATHLVAGAYMTRWGLDWMPLVTPMDEYAGYANPQDGLPVVCQTASARYRQFTDLIEHHLGGRKDMTLKIIENVPHGVCLQERGKAHIALGCFRGYGMAELEAWSMRQPVISFPMSPEDEAAELEQIGFLPYYKARVEELPDVIDDFLSSPSLYKEWAERGYEFARKFHDAPVVARRFTEFCEQQFCEQL